MTSATKVFRCVLCDEAFSEQDVLNGLYFIETLVCRKCYRELQLAPYHVRCFGKPTVKNCLGYDSAAEECSNKCKDRFICSEFVEDWVKVHDKD